MTGQPCAECSQEWELPSWGFGESSASPPRTEAVYDEFGWLVRSTSLADWDPTSESQERCAELVPASNFFEHPSDYDPFDFLTNGITTIRNGKSVTEYLLPRPKPASAWANPPPAPPADWDPTNESQECRLDAEPADKSGLGRGAAGFQCLRNKNYGIPIEPWFDFVVGINGRQIDNSDPHLFATEVRNCAGGSVSLTLWSAKGQSLRDLNLSIPTPSPTLGLTLQWTPLSATYDIWHILEVIPNSPADQAGLLPYGDYIIGTPEGLVRGESGLGELVEDYLSRPLRLHVYNHEYGVVREVTITPSRNWGGEGALGCVLGFGALHRIPPPLEEPPAGPGETLFETARLSHESTRPRSTSPSKYTPQGQPPLDTTGPLSQQPGANPFSLSSPSLLVPAAINNPPPLISTTSPPNGAGTINAPPRSGGRKLRATSPGKGLAFDEYWKESEEKSREVDFAPSKGAKATPPPPPPKSQGMVVETHLPIPPHSGGEPRQTRSPDPILDDDSDEELEEVSENVSEEG